MSEHPCGNRYCTLQYGHRGFCIENPRIDWDDDVAWSETALRADRAEEEEV